LRGAATCANTRHELGKAECGSAPHPARAKRRGRGGVVKGALRQVLARSVLARAQGRALRSAAACAPALDNAATPEDQLNP